LPAEGGQLWPVVLQPRLSRITAAPALALRVAFFSAAPAHVVDVRRISWPSKRAASDAEAGDHLNTGSLQFAGSGMVIGPAGVAANGVNGNGSRSEVVAVPVLSLQPGESPRLQGEDKAHIARLAETQTPLPPILVHRRSMRVIDGMHRLLAASMKGQETINVEFFDGSPADAFLRGVVANVTHGLPLSQADRRAAAERIMLSHPYMSDRAIGESAGLAARTVASIRRRSPAVPQVDARVGRDGKVRPLDGLAGRRRAAELMAKRPQASLREVARAAGVSPATAADVRKRLERGEEPGPAWSGAAVAGANEAEPCAPLRRTALPGKPMTPALVVAKLLRDPSLRGNEHGRWLLRLLQHNAEGAREWPGAIVAVPPHCTALVVQLSRQYAQMWLGIAQKLDERSRIIDPRASQR
jgi:hypothetical protein